MIISSKEKEKMLKGLLDDIVADLSVHYPDVVVLQEIPCGVGPDRVKTFKVALEMALQEVGCR